MSGDWWEEFYDDLFADLILEGYEASALEATLDFLVARLSLAPGARVFDQCCGTGRLSVPLAQRGHAVVGVDLAEEYLRRARAAAAAAGVRCELHRGDAFDFVPHPPCDGAFNWFTSFGFADDDARNRKMMQRAFEALRPGRRFALDYLNVANVIREFQAAQTSRFATPRGEVLFVRETRPDFARGRLEQTWTYLLPDGRRVVRRGGTQMYLPHDLIRMASDAGFRDAEIHGGVCGEPFGLSSRRCILLARKPE